VRWECGSTLDQNERRNHPLPSTPPIASVSPKRMALDTAGVSRPAIATMERIVAETLPPVSIAALINQIYFPERQFIGTDRMSTYLKA
jgi:hypothetical protein